jgi:large subunit ribosomal protein L21
MYAIVEIAGQQFKVEKGQELYVHRLNSEEGSDVRFDDVLLIDNNGKIRIGTPTIEGAFVSAKVISHLKGDKVLVFKKRRRKGFQKLNGHRDLITKIQIDSILISPEKVKKTEVAEEVKEAKVPAPKKKTAEKAKVKESAKPKVKESAEEVVKAKKPRAKAIVKKTESKPRSRKAKE